MGGGISKIAGLEAALAGRCERQGFVVCFEGHSLKQLSTKFVEQLV